jgi:hypothetical protein
VQSYTDIVPLEQELLSALPQQSLGNTRGVLWHRCADSGSLEGEPLIALKQPVVASSVYRLNGLPPAILACAYSDLDDGNAEREPTSRSENG